MGSKIKRTGAGFASMTPERLREVSASGGRAASKDTRPFKDRELAKRAGKIGGKWPRKGRGKK